MYNILVEDTNTKEYSFLKVKQEITETQEVDDGSGNMITQQVGTGEYETVTYETDDKDELKAKCIELMSTYPKSEVIPIENLAYTVDIAWS